MIHTLPACSWLAPKWLHDSFIFLPRLGPVWGWITNMPVEGFWYHLTIWKYSMEWFRLYVKTTSRPLVHIGCEPALGQSAVFHLGVLTNLQRLIFFFSFFLGILVLWILVLWILVVWKLVFYQFPLFFPLGLSMVQEQVRSKWLAWVTVLGCACVSEGCATVRTIRDDRGSPILLSMKIHFQWGASKWQLCLLV